MKKFPLKLLICFILIGILLTGCSLINTSTKEVNTLIDKEGKDNTNEEDKDIEENEEEIDILGEELLRFFRQYYSANEEGIIALNAYPVNINDAYVESYEDYTDNSLKLLEGFMTEGLEKNLQKPFFKTDVHFPRFVKVNGNVIIGYTDVKDVHYKIIKEEDRDLTIEVDVDVKAEVITEKKFNELFESDKKTRYFTKKNEKAAIEDSDKDEIKVRCSYVLEIHKNNIEEISLFTLKEKGEVSVPEENRRNIINNDFLKRINYLESAPLSDDLLIRDFLYTFMNQDKDAYQYYQYAFDADVDTYKAMVYDLGIENYLLVDEKNYQSQFPNTILPTKDDIISINMSKEGIDINVHTETSKKTKVYIVDFLAAAKLSDYNASNLKYRYYITLEHDEEFNTKITRIQYISMNPSFDETENESEESGESEAVEEITNEE
ncbi:MAG: hypothetical protein GX308_02215 [Epulopiscium sp.]|nr:hypothetical protein [Candidatus Epulonipiscium sp.]